MHEKGNEGYLNFLEGLKKSVNISAEGNQLRQKVVPQELQNGHDNCTADSKLVSCQYKTTVQEILFRSESFLDPTVANLTADSERLHQFKLIDG